MSKHLSLRSGNPALSAETFKGITLQSDEVMTINGTVNKTAISLLLLIMAGTFTFSGNYNLILPGFLGGFVVAIITIFKECLLLLFQYTQFLKVLLLALFLKYMKTILLLQMVALTE